MDLYAAIDPRTSAAAARATRLRSFVVATGEGACVIGLKAGEGSIEHFPVRHDDDVESRRRFQFSEQLAGKALGPVPHDRGTQLSCGRYAQSTPHAPILRHEQRHEAAAQAQAVLIGLLEFRTPSDPFVAG